MAPKFDDLQAMSPTTLRQSLGDMKRTQLQTVAKKFGLKGNLKTLELIGAVADHLYALNNPNKSGSKSDTVHKTPHNPIYNPRYAQTRSSQLNAQHSLPPRPSSVKGTKWHITKSKELADLEAQLKTIHWSTRNKKLTIDHQSTAQKQLQRPTPKRVFFSPDVLSLSQQRPPSHPSSSKPALASKFPVLKSSMKKTGVPSRFRQSSASSLPTPSRACASRTKENQTHADKYTVQTHSQTKHAATITATTTHPTIHCQTTATVSPAASRGLHQPSTIKRGFSAATTPFSIHNSSLITSTSAATKKKASSVIVDDVPSLNTLNTLNHVIVPSPALSVQSNNRVHGGSAATPSSTGFSSFSSSIITAKNNKKRTLIPPSSAKSSSTRDRAQICTSPASGNERREKAQQSYLKRMERARIMRMARRN